MKKIELLLSLGPSVVEKVVDSRYRYDTNTNLANFRLGIGDLMTPETNPNLTIGDPMPSVPDPILTIESYREIS
jgi:hypothetical protein